MTWRGVAAVGSTATVALGIALLGSGGARRPAPGLGAVARAALPHAERDRKRDELDARRAADDATASQGALGNGDYDRNQTIDWIDVASGAGAVTGDAALAPGTVLFTVRLELASGATAGVVFDGTSAGFTLPSGGLRNRAGTTVVEAGQVGIGKLEVR